MKGSARKLEGQVAGRAEVKTKARRNIANWPVGAVRSPSKGMHWLRMPVKISDITALAPTVNATRGRRGALHG